MIMSADGDDYVDDVAEVQDSFDDTAHQVLITSQQTNRILTTAELLHIRTITYGSRTTNRTPSEEAENQQVCKL
jgi:hypothetical protein